MATNNINTEDVRVYAKALRLGNLRNNCSEIIHQAQIDKPSYLDFILTSSRWNWMCDSRTSWRRG